ncbi:MAG TPA: hypothetical protein VL093_09935 [Flavipsychrobacter sp.]|nr:hypothetical protein [Flavipsychrobacter sp.]
MIVHKLYLKIKNEGLIQPPDSLGFVPFGYATLRLTPLRRENPLSTLLSIYTVYFILPGFTQNGVIERVFARPNLIFTSLKGSFANAKVSSVSLKVVFVSAKISFANPKPAFACPKVSFVSPKLIFATPNVPFACPKLIFVSTKISFANPKLAFVSPKMVFASPKVVFASLKKSLSGAIARCQCLNKKERLYVSVQPPPSLKNSNDYLKNNSSRYFGSG